jgi:hypothetical protein
VVDNSGFVAALRSKIRVLDESEDVEAYACMVNETSPRPNKVLLHALIEIAVQPFTHSNIGQLINLYRKSMIFQAFAKSFVTMSHGYSSKASYDWESSQEPMTIEEARNHDAKLIDDY